MYKENEEYMKRMSSFNDSNPYTAYFCNFTNLYEANCQGSINNKYLFISVYSLYNNE